MNIFGLIPEVRNFVDDRKAENKKIGFVPTMGALHSGHLSLIERSVKENDITIASIFVNPTQFNDKNDLQNYPRDIDRDLNLLKSVGCDAVFTPDELEMYPEKDTRVFEFDGLENRMEGEHRPGHFNGVAQIVSKLFDAVPATNAYFGQKDFQQLTIIRSLVEQLKTPIRIIACDIIREPNGLAMSSRNERLDKNIRNKASIIYSTLKQIKEKSKAYSIQELKRYGIESINSVTPFKVEYLDIVNSSTLLTVNNKEDAGEVVVCIAVWAYNVRLIDNIVFNF